MTAITVTPGDVFHNKFGKYTHDSMVGVKFGSKLHSPPPQSGYIHLLRPTPELWTLSLPHRTQILYQPDISYITMRLGVRPGGRVMEAGTGSGSMTHALSRCVGTNGRGVVRSFEYHRRRYEAALDEFRSHGLSNVQLEHRNVCKDGFGDASKMEAVFLDLPAPWEAVPHAMKALRDDTITRICCFSPCLEQVLKTVSTLRAEGWSDISTQEVLVRTHELVPPPLPSSSQLHDISSIVDRLKVHEKRKEERRVVQMRNAREKARKLKEEKNTATTGEARENEAEDVVTTAEEADVVMTGNAEGKRKIGDVGEGEHGAAKRARVGKSTTNPPPIDSCGPSASEPDVDHRAAVLVDEADRAYPPIWTEPSTTLSSQILTKPTAEMRGHTSYLTFAVLHPLSIRQATAPSRSDKQIADDAPPAAVAALAGDVESEDRAGRAAREESEFADEEVEMAMAGMTEEEVVALAETAR